jgi:hypothetical protein
VRRVALAVCLALALLPCVPARTLAAETLLDTFTAISGPARVAESTVAFKAGTRYRMEISGAIGRADPTIGVTVDARYCFQTTMNTCQPPSEQNSDVAFANGTHTPTIGETQPFVDFAEPGKGFPDYNPDHVYSIEFEPLDGARKLYVMTWPFKEDRTDVTYSGAFTVRVYGPASAVTPPAPKSGFGVTNTFTSPAPGGALLAVSPTIPASATRLGFSASLAGAAPGRTSAASRLRITDKKTLVAACAIWGPISLSVSQTQLPAGSSTSASDVFRACAGLLSAQVNRRAAAPAARLPCRATFVPLMRRGTRISASNRRIVLNFIRSKLATSCSATTAGGITVAMRTKGSGTSMRALLGPNTGVGLVRSRSSRADGPRPRLSLRWNR